MHINRILLSASLVVVALVLQVTVLARLQLPGAVPDLLLLVVLGLALVYGHTAGASSASSPDCSPTSPRPPTTRSAATRWCSA